jgi:hypothetical protein
VSEGVTGTSIGSESQNTWNKMNFTNWIAKIDEILFAKWEVRLTDLPDESFMDYYDERLSPEEVINIMIEHNIECPDMFQILSPVVTA